MSADKRLKASGLKLAKKLEEATQAMNDYLRACWDAGMEDQRGISDSRRLLIEDMSEYSSYLDSVYNK